MHHIEGYGNCLIKSNKGVVLSTDLIYIQNAYCHIYKGRGKVVWKTTLPQHFLAVKILKFSHFVLEGDVTVPGNLISALTKYY